MDGKKKILIAGASAGVGHMRAAQALKKSFEARPDEVVTHFFDIIDLAGPLFRRIYSGGYEVLAAKLPLIWRKVYEVSDRRGQNGWMARAINRAFNGKLLRLAQRENYDAILCTHFLPPELLCPLKRAGKLRAKIMVAVTDFDLHSFWAVPGVDDYFVAADLIRWRLKEKNIVPEERIHVTGIPIDPAFAEQKSPADIRARYGLDPDKPCVLLMSSGFAYGNFLRIPKIIADIRPDAQILAVAGKNTTLKKDLEKIRIPNPAKMIVFGFVDNVHELMTVSDLLLSKSGGLSSSEALASGLPMIITHCIAGQEEANMRFLLENGAACLALSLPELTYKLKNLLENPPVLLAMKRCAKSLGNPESAQSIRTLVLNRI